MRTMQEWNIQRIIIEFGARSCDFKYRQWSVEFVQYEFCSCSSSPHTLFQCNRTDFWLNRMCLKRRLHIGSWAFSPMESNLEFGRELFEQNRDNCLRNRIMQFIERQGAKKLCFWEICSFAERWGIPGYKKNCAGDSIVWLELASNPVW